MAVRLGGSPKHTETLGSEAPWIKGSATAAALAAAFAGARNSGRAQSAAGPGDEVGGGAAAAATGPGAVGSGGSSSVGSARGLVPGVVARSSDGATAGNLPVATGSSDRATAAKRGAESAGGPLGIATAGGGGATEGRLVVIGRDGKKRYMPRDDEMCVPGSKWGEGGRWIEPWDEAAALETVELLDSHWHGKKGHAAKAAAAAAARYAAGADAAGDARVDGVTSDDDGDGDGDGDGGGDTRDWESTEKLGRGSMSLDGSDDEDGGSGFRRSAAPCHVACGRLGFCIVEELQRTRNTYSAKGAEVFKRKAMERAINVVEAHQVRAQLNPEGASTPWGYIHTLKAPCEPSLTVKDLSHT